MDTCHRVCNARARGDNQYIRRVCVYALSVELELRSESEGVLALALLRSRRQSDRRLAHGPWRLCLCAVDHRLSFVARLSVTGNKKTLQPTLQT